MPDGWAAPCPLLLPLRPPALVAEETAWLAARFPGRVGLGVAAGALAVDFEIMGVSMDHLTARFAGGLELVVATTAEEVARRLLDVQRAAGVDALNLRVHVPGVSAEAGREQITRLGDEVLPLLQGSR
jgi:alkanesulfonate monooxygenase SsuD/methylene tetrahydromethanopterin reductase-like flavin-dependent oxidoreductase (luciferase family)